MTIHLQEVRAKIIEAVSEIVAVDFGCRAKWNNPESTENKVKSKPHDIVVIRKWSNGPISILWETESNLIRSSATVFPSDLYDIIGRPITLADVLRAIEVCRGDEMTEVGDAICVTTDGNIWELKGAPVENDWTDYPYGCRWNLALSLDEQEPEVVEFLHSLLVTKKV